MMTCWKRQRKLSISSERAKNELKWRVRRGEIYSNTLVNVFNVVFTGFWGQHQIFNPLFWAILTFSRWVETTIFILNINNLLLWIWNMSNRSRGFPPAGMFVTPPEVGIMLHFRWQHINEKNRVPWNWDEWRTLNQMAIATLWVFPKIGVPQNGWFLMENPVKIDDLGAHPYFWKHPCATWCHFLRTLLKHPQLDVNDSSGLLHCAMKRTDSISVDLAAWLLEQETLDINLRRWGFLQAAFQGTFLFQKIMFLGVFWNASNSRT